MRILLVSEGKHEQSGALKNLVGRLLAREFECDQEPVKNNAIHAHHGGGQGYMKKAIRWILEAQRRGYDALVLLIDEDNKAERLREIEQAQAYFGPSTTLPRALGVAVRTFDAWMLADETALTRVLGRPVPRQRDPEAQSQPKAICAQLLDECGGGIAQSEL